MGRLQESVALQTYLTQNYTSTPVKFENDQQNDLSLQEWVRMSVQEASSSQITMGSNPLFRYASVLFFQIFVKPDIGSGRALEIVDTLSPLFNSKRIGDMTFMTPLVERVGVVRDWYQLNLSVEFYREELRS